MRASSSSPIAGRSAEGRAERRLDDQWPAGAADRQQHGARVLWRADLPEPVRSEAGNEGHMGERLDVLHQGGATPDARARGWS